MKCTFVARQFPEFPGSLLPGCYKSRMSKSEPRKVHIAEVRTVRNGVTYTSVYLRRTFREDGKVKHETLGNLNDLPRDLIELMRQRLAQRRRREDDYPAKPAAWECGRRADNTPQHRTGADDRITSVSRT